MTNQIELSQNQLDTVLQLWQTDLEQLRPVLVDCPDGRYPARDADGYLIFENTHFESEEAAWQRLEKELTSKLYLTGCALIEAEKQTQKRKEDAADIAKAWATFENNRTAARFNLECDE